jgi:hypothetical protein
LRRAPTCRTYEVRQEGRLVVKPNAEPADPACGVCRMPIRSGDHVMASHGDLLHVRCVGWNDVAQRLATFLAEREDLRYCHTCLMSLLSIAYEDTRAAVMALRNRLRVRVAVGVCSECAESRATVQSRTGRAIGEESERRERIVERLQTGGLPRFLLTTVEHWTSPESEFATGPGMGKLCSGCDAVLDGLDGRSREFVVRPGYVLRFHRRCYELWDEERHKAPLR